MTAADRTAPLLIWALPPLAVAVAAFVRVLAMPALGTAAPFSTFALATFVTALLAGRWPAVAAIALSIPTGWWLLLGETPGWRAEPAEVAGNVAIFVVIVGAGVALIGHLRRALLRSRLLEAELDATRLRLEGALKGGQMGVYEWRIPEDRALWDAAAYDLWDVPEGVPVTKGMVRDRVHPDDLGAFDANMAQALDPAGDGVRDVTYRVMTRDGAEVLRWLHVRAKVEFDDTGRPLRMVGVNRDVTDLKRAEAQRELLIGELDHRVKNLFAVVLSILSLAARRHDTVADLVAAVRPRIEALARAHGTSLGRSGSEEGVALEEILANVLAPHRDGSGRIVLRGGPVDLRVSAVTPLGLMVHELATNAVKHGALATQAGRVTVGWDVTDGTVRIDWRETGGAAATRTGGGFGQTLLEATAKQLRGTLEAVPGPDGLHVRIAFPLSV